ncbi:MAG TPA: ATP-dependent zinc metalloprotease FtsH [Clostridiales bacterium]|jgi:cell division protease FtsH|nr:ATP-dependent zinc metalloprotease FtsH [Clostridiales bacterium]
MLLKNIKWKQLLPYVIIPVFLIIMLTTMLSRTTQKKTEYYQLVNMFLNDEIAEYSLNLTSGDMKYKTRKEPNIERSYTVPNVTMFIEDVHKYVVEHNKERPESEQVKFDYIAGTSGAWIINLVPILAFCVILLFGIFFVSKRMDQTIANESSRALSFGKARVKLGKDDKRKTTFADVAGAEEEKEELVEIVEFLKDPSRFSQLGARIPKGVLLVGPPGTGKTLLSRAVAGEANVPFYSISGSDFLEMYVGVGAARVRDLFNQAKKSAPCIVFIDEIDAVGRHRGAGMGGGHDEREQTLNQLLVEMDGFVENEGVIVLAATNRPDILDPALLRPGRFDRQITVGYPDAKGREEILRVHSRKKPLAPDVDLGVIARSTVGFTGADLENLLNEAALLAARRKKRAITMAEIEEATVKVLVGAEKRSKKQSEKDRKLTAYHEAGHAVVSYFLETQDPVHQISIIARGMAGGYTMSVPKEDRSYTSKSSMIEDIVELLGGRIAEALIIGDISTGASNDIERATDIARKMVTRYGMSETLGPIAFGTGHDEVFLGKEYGTIRNYSELTASEIDNEINRIITNAYNRGKEILSDNVHKLHLVANALLEFEKISGEDFKRLMDAKNEEEENEVLESMRTAPKGSTGTTLYSYHTKKAKEEELLKQFKDEVTNTEKEAAEPETAKDTEPAPENAAEAEKEDAEDSEEK